ncbi:hypothetical protein NHX12_009031 [Muraenolepis orangiensis]|uniref:RHD domain-containing protein n=1 Tax=Muraenolepis orangiensis TaxID=630683 RepID=A0A9Q0I9Y0_9TELE|nr:hypothetical protein NHX12_009031 [Muraenolepis orangiensis]
MVSLSPDVASFAMRSVDVFNGTKANITDLDIIEELITEDSVWGQQGAPHLPGPHLPGPHLPGPPPPPADHCADEPHSGRRLGPEPYSSKPLLVARGTAPMAPCSFSQPFQPPPCSREMASGHPCRGAPPSGASRRGRGPSCQAGPRNGVGPASPSSSRARSDAEPLERLLEKPKLVVVEEPKERGMRFRYECEGRSAGSILGASSTGASKIQPAIEIQGSVDNMKKVTVTVSLVTKDIPYRPHPHCLVGKDCPEGSGICVVSFNPHTNTQHSFANLGIQCVRRKELDASLQKRRSQNIDPFRTGQSKSIEDMDMNVVRLCFQCDLEWEDGRKDCLSPVVSNPIYDKKATTTSQLKITCLNIIKGSCTGSTEIYMLCDKVQKDDIEIIFKRGPWEAKGEFAQTDVHRQIAIVFKTPPYQEQDITEEMEVDVMLRRISDRMDSEPVSFTYLPHNPDPYEVKRKRKIKTDISLAEQACVAVGPSAHSAAMEVSGSQAFTGFPSTGTMAELPPLPAHSDASALGDMAYNEPQDMNMLGNYDVLLTQLLEMPTIQAMLSDPALNTATLLEPGSTTGTYSHMDGIFNNSFSTYGQDFSQYNDMQFNHMVSESQPELHSQEPTPHKVQVKTEED